MGKICPMPSIPKKLIDTAADLARKAADVAGRLRRDEDDTEVPPRRLKPARRPTPSARRSPARPPAPKSATARKPKAKAQAKAKAKPSGRGATAKAGPAVKSPPVAASKEPTETANAAVGGAETGERR